MNKMFSSTLLILAVCALVALVGCEGEKGADGPAGPAGTAGVSGTAACGTCHDVSTDIVAKQIQYEQSTHAMGSAYLRGTSASCAPCHSSEGFTQKVAGLEVTGADNPTPPNCRTCHNIHTNYDATDYALATTAPVTLTGSMTVDATIDLGKGNLCANCHQTRLRTYGLEVGGADIGITSTHFGPHHGVQSNVLTGNSGYEFAGSMAYDDSPHAAMIEDGCVTCHMSAPGTTSGGHTFTPNDTACAECHSDFDGFDVNGAQTEIKELISTLAALLEAELLVHMDEEGAYHNLKIESTTNAKAGALFNFIMIQNEDGSNGVHNFKYTKALLTNSIEALQ